MDVPDAAYERKRSSPDDSDQILYTVGTDHLTTRRTKEGG
jgi:hypothetical protein